MATMPAPAGGTPGPGGALAPASGGGGPGLEAPAEVKPNPLLGLGRLSPARQAILLMALAASVALGVGGALWLQEPAWVPLRGPLAGKDAQLAVETLERAGIPHRVAEDGSLLVAESKRRLAELTLADLDLPGSDGVGVEVLDEEPSFGTTPFREQRRYLHALEVHLARTIAEMRDVEHARVHLALPRRSAFVRPRTPPSASVMVRPRPGRRLNEEQVATIAHLVAEAVPELDARDVTQT